MKNSTFYYLDGKYYGITAESIINPLPAAVYTLQVDGSKGFLILTKECDQFQFNYNIYNFDTKFIENVIKVYKHNPEKNLDLLLDGIKGTGKSVTSKLLCNEFIKLGLPVIIVSETIYTGDDNDLSSLFSEIMKQITFPCVIFADEYEKTFNDSDVLLQHMDGAVSFSPKVFILTSNRKQINENLVSRPSRIRYVKTYGNLSKVEVKIILDNELEDKSLIDEVLDYISNCSIITIDIVKEIIKEINILGFDQEFMDEHLNVREGFSNVYDIYQLQINNGTKTLVKIYDSVQLSHNAERIRNHGYKNIRNETTGDILFKIISCTQDFFTVKFVKEYAADEEDYVYDEEVSYITLKPSRLKNIAF